MGTNYYAEWRLGGGNPGPVELVTPPVALHLHICKSLTSFQGALFNSWSAWKHFLVSHEERITITDEYGVNWSVQKFIQRVEETEPINRRRQYDWVVRNSPDHRTWLCPDGFSFHNGEFS